MAAVLAYVKALQDREKPPTVKTNSEKNGYQKTGRKGTGPKSFLDRIAARRATQANLTAQSRAAAILDVSAAPL